MYNVDLTALTVADLQQLIEDTHVEIARREALG